MLEAVSRPVRTPSWMPRGNVQLIWVRNLAPVAAAYARAQRQELAIEAAPGNPSEVSLWEVHGIVGHHSNGQDGCFDPVAFTIQGSCFPTLRGGWGYFIRFYSGQDYYNIRFFNDIRRLHVGFTYSQSGFFRFTKGAVGEGDGGTAVRR